MPRQIFKVGETVNVPDKDEKPFKVSHIEYYICRPYISKNVDLRKRLVLIDRDGLSHAFCYEGNGAIYWVLADIERVYHA